MLTNEQRLTLQSMDPARTDPATLADIRHIRPDHTQPVPARLAAYLAAVHNPYLFRVGDTTVQLACAENGESLSALLGRLLENG